VLGQSKQGLNCVVWVQQSAGRRWSDLREDSTYTQAVERYWAAADDILDAASNLDRTKRSESGDWGLVIGCCRRKIGLNCREENSRRDRK
jgi:hypothetical protein